MTTDFGFFDDALAVAIQPNGKIVAAGTAFTDGGGDFALARYNPDGSLDTSFNLDGKVTTDFGLGDLAIAMAVRPNGKIVAAGIVSSPDGTDFALARYNPDGSLDATFGSGGKVTTDFGDFEAALGIAILPDGRIVAAGITFQAGTGYDFALARYLAR